MAGRVGLLLALISLLVLLLPAAQAHLQISRYTLRGSGCGAIADPNNESFHPSAGETAAGVVVRDHIRHHAGWGGRTGGTQSVRNHNRCRVMADQASAGSGVLGSQKRHIRLFENYDSPLVSFGDAHVERVVTCPLPRDAVYESINGRSGFDDGARRLNAAFRGTHHTYGSYARVPNRRTFPQCNGDEPGWNGRVHYWIGNFLTCHGRCE